MFIIDKNNIPEEIVEDETRFYETTYLLFSKHQLQADEIDNYFKKYNKQLSLSAWLDKSYDLKRYFDDLESRSLKANNSTFLRYFIKDLKRKVVFKSMGQNNTKRLIGLLISEIILEASEICYQNLFREKYMALFEATMDSYHLKNEFESIVIQLLQPMWNGLVDEIPDQLYAKFILYRKIHGKYLVELALDDFDCQKLSEYKSQLQDIIAMNENEADKKAYALSKELDKKQEKFNQALNDYMNHNDLQIEEKNSKAKMYLETDFSQINDENVLHLIEEHKEEIVKQNNKQNESRFKKIYQQYFLYDQDNYENYYLKIGQFNEIHLQASQMNFCSFTDYLYIIYIAHIKNEINNKMELLLKFEDYYNDAKALTNNFLHLLAFHLWNDGNEEKMYQRIDAFQKVIDEIPQCHKMFLNLREDPLSDDYIDFDATAFDFTPLHLYYNHIVMAVIINIDIPSVARRLKAIILSFYQSFDLIEKSKEYTRIYEQGILKNDFAILHGFADLFVLSYLKDKKLIASYSPFLRYFDDNFFDEDALFSTRNEEQTIIYLREQIDYDLKYRKKLVQAKKEFEMLLDELHQQDKLVLKKFDMIEEIMNISLKSSYFFNPIVNKENILKKYKYKLITFLANHSQDFFDHSLDEKVDQLLCISFIYHYIETIEQYEQYMPKKEQLQHEEYVQSLKSIIEDKEHIIEIKNKQIDNINVKRKTKQNIQKNKLFDEEIKYYKQEISTLNKQLKTKDIEIENLKKNQTELYKLRELIFEMQQNDEDRQKQISFDLYEVIKDKTIIIIGGHISLRDRLKQKYPTLKILSELSLITDAVLLHADHVFMFHKFMTHDMYNRAISVLSRNNIPWDYVPYTNLEKAEEVIYNVLKA